MKNTQNSFRIIRKNYGMNDLAAMQVFVSVVETGGLSSAGRALGLAPSSVTRRIGELEGRLGVTLLQRTTRRMSLTEAGEIFYERSRDIVRAVEEATLAVTEKRANPNGTLRLTAPASVARLHLAPAVAAFQKRFPAVRVMMSVTDRMADVVGEGLDVAIRVGQLEDSSLMARKVGECRRLICAAPSYLDKTLNPSRPEDLADHACLCFRDSPGTNRWKFDGGKEATEVRVTGPFFTDDGETLVAAACAGLGVILAPEWLVGLEISRGRLIEVLDGYILDPATAPLHAVTAPGPYTAPKIRKFIEFLVNRFSGGYSWRDAH